LVTVDVDGLEFPLLAGLAALLLLLAPGFPPPDVLEELELLVDERLALAFGLPLLRRRAGPDVRELPDRGAVQRHGEGGVVPHEVDGPAVAAEDRAHLGRARVREPPPRARAPLAQEP